MARSLSLTRETEKRGLLGLAVDVWAVLLTAIGMAVAPIIFVIRLEGRLDAHQVKATAIEQRIDTHEQVEQNELEQLRDDVRYIRQRIDQVLDTRAK